LQKGQQKLEQGQQKLEQGQQKLEQGQQKLEQGQQELRSNLTAATKEVAEAQGNLTGVVTSSHAEGLCTFQVRVG
jgi:hypothetical protein